MHEEVDWLILGGFNLMRRPADRNKPGGDANEMLLFNEAISALGLVELPLYAESLLGLISNSHLF